MRESTKIIRSTLTPVVAGEPLHAGPVFAGLFHTPGDISQTAYTYGRTHNPTWTELENTIAQIESGENCTASALVFASGIAAIAAVFGTVLRPGDIVVMPTNSYYTARKLMQEYFVEMGIIVRSAPTANDAQGELLDGARLLWLETPSNPTMEVCDIAALCELAHAAGALVAVDNSTPTALGQKPLALGADFSVASDTKSMTGHSDMLLGHVAMRADTPEGAALHQKIHRWRTLTGGVVGPMEAWLALRSIATLPLRLERSCENALRIAEFLTTRAEVESVLYPGLPSHPAHAVAARQMQLFGPVLGFALADQAAAETFLTSSKLVTDATSFGGISTTAERRAKWGGDDVCDGFIRMSAGCEAIEDLIEDIAQALDAVR